jgi:hypothetical protein
MAERALANCKDPTILTHQSLAFQNDYSFPKQNVKLGKWKIKLIDC